MNWKVALGGLAALLAYYRHRPGHALHELLHIPDHWYRCRQVLPSGFSMRKLPYGDHPRQYFLLSVPPEGIGQQKLMVIFFHGGAWRFGQPEHFQAYAAFFAQRGYAVALPSYRRIPGARMKEMREDLRQLLPVVHKAIEETGMDIGGLLVGGMSSGGHLAAHLALDATLQHKALPVRAGLFFAAPLDLEALPRSILRDALAGKPGSAFFQQANPIHLLDRPAPPAMLLVHGSSDGLVPQACSSRFLARARAVGTEDIQWIDLEGGTHLDAMSWVHRPNRLRRQVLDWLERL